MWFSSWLRNRPASATLRPANRFRPQLEVLEDWCVPATFLVTTVADVLDPGDGVLSLREAILAANATSAADTIVVPAGTYTLTRAGIVSEESGLSGDLDIGTSNLGSLTISGAGAGSTIIDGGNLDRVFDVHSNPTVSISGLTIQGGNAGRYSGGGIFNMYGKLTVSNCTFSDNTAGGTGGGAIMNGSGTLTVNHCTFTDNAATDLGFGYTDRVGGAIWNLAGTVTISDSSFTDNSARSGGGILNQGTLTVSNCTFSDNSATGSGGGIANKGTMTVNNSTLSGNSAGVGGGIYNSSGTLTVNSSTITANTATVSGGGIYNSGKLTLRGSTVTDNTASLGADLYVSKGGKVVLLSGSTIGDRYDV